jgi:hypothetical protein
METAPRQDAGLVYPSDAGFSSGEFIGKAPLKNNSPQLKDRLVFFAPETCAYNHGQFHPRHPETAAKLNNRMSLSHTPKSTPITRSPTNP